MSVSSTSESAHLFQIAPSLHLDPSLSSHGFLSFKSLPSVHTQLPQPKRWGANWALNLNMWHQKTKWQCWQALDHPQAPQLPSNLTWTELDAASNRYPKAFIDHRWSNCCGQFGSSRRLKLTVLKRRASGSWWSRLWHLCTIPVLAHVVCMCAKYRYLIIKQTTHVRAHVNNS